MTSGCYCTELHSSRCFGCPLRSRSHHSEGWGAGLFSATHSSLPPVLRGNTTYLELAHNHADDAAIWRGLMVLCRDAVLDFLERKALQKKECAACCSQQGREAAAYSTALALTYRQLLHNSSFPLELLSFPRKAWCVNLKPRKHRVRALFGKKWVQTSVSLLVKKRTEGSFHTLHY